MEVLNCLDGPIGRVLVRDYAALNFEMTQTNEATFNNFIP